MKEVRSCDQAIVMRSGDKDSRLVEGYALVFNSASKDLGGFREYIAPGALDGVLEQSDIYALFNHDVNRGILARWRGEKGSLDLEVDETGLRYSFDAPKTALGDELLEGLRRGDISQSSFAFTVKDEQWEKVGEGEYKRTITKFDRLFDVSPVLNPAYEATSVQCNKRGMEELIEKEAEEMKAAEEAKRAEEEAKKAEMAEYYQSLEDKIQ